MSVYQIRTNYGTSHIRATAAEVQRRMWAYIREQRAAGMRLADVHFVYRRIV